MTRFLLLGLALILSACVEGELDIHFAPDESVTGDGRIIMEQSAYGLASLMRTGGGDGACGAMAVRVTTAGVICTGSAKTTLSEIERRQTSAKANPPTQFEPARAALAAARFERIGSDRLRVVIPLDVGQNLAATLQDFGASRGIDGAEAQIMEAFKGKMIRLRISGAEILETNGGVKKGVNEVLFQIPATELLKPTGALRKTFSATIRFR